MLAATMKQARTKQRGELDALGHERSATAALAARALLAWMALACGACDGRAGEQPAADPAGAGAEPKTALTADDLVAHGELARLECAQPTIDFGEVFEGAQLEHTFELHNAGDVDALVVKLKPGCSCSLVEATLVAPDGTRGAYAENDPIPPDHRLRVRVRVDTRERRGRVPKGVTLYGNMEGNAIELEILADVKPYLTVDPERVLLGRFSTLETRSAPFLVEGRVEPFALEALAAALPEHVSVELEPLEPDADGRALRWTGRVRVGPGAERGPRSWRVELLTDRPHPDALAHEASEPAVHGTGVWIVAQVVGPVDASEAALAFGIVREGQATARTVRVESFDPDFGPQFELEEPFVYLRGPEGGPFEHESAFRLSARPVEGAAAWDVEAFVEGPPDAAAGPFRGVLVVEVGHPEVYDLAIPFSGIFQPLRR